MRRCLAKCSCCFFPSHWKQTVTGQCHFFVITKLSMSFYQFWEHHVLLSMYSNVIFMFVWAIPCTSSLKDTVYGLSHDEMCVITTSLIFSGDLYGSHQRGFTQHGCDGGQSWPWTPAGRGHHHPCCGTAGCSGTAGIDRDARSWRESPLTTNTPQEKHLLIRKSKAFHWCLLCWFLK